MWMNIYRLVIFLFWFLALKEMVEDKRRLGEGGLKRRKEKEKKEKKEKREKRKRDEEKKRRTNSTGKYGRLSLYTRSIFSWASCA